MTRLRRIETQNRFFFVTTNLREGVTPLSSAEYSLILAVLAQQQSRGQFFLFGYVVMPTHVHLLLYPRHSDLSRIMRDFKSRTGYEIAQARGIRGPI